ncbi:MAG TPA: FAD-binding oxidoreductase [Acidimicrobiia bacterium]
MATADAVVVGAGIAGVAAAHQLAVRRGVGRVVIVDPRPPLTLTSDKSTECYRNWWPNIPMVGLMNRSIDLLEEFSEESGGAFGLSRRGYLFVTADLVRLALMEAQADLITTFGAGAVRRHPGPDPYGDYPDGVDILDSAELRRHFPYLTPDAVGGVHVRRAGWFSAQQLGAWMLEESARHGATRIVDTVTSIQVPGDRVGGVSLAGGETIESPIVVAAAGPFSAHVAALAGVELPLKSELHLKVAFRDHLGVIPRDAPMVIWSDPQRIDWSDEEREGLAEMGRDDLLGDMPVFCHGRPEGGEESQWFLGLWEYHRHVYDDPVYPLPEDQLYPEAVIRGLATMIPGLAAYRDHLPEARVDGGYYTKTVENRPLIGPAGPEGLYLVCGFSGFGVMVAAGAADLLAAHIAGEPLPAYADAFLLSRYDDPAYMEELSRAESGQL